MSSESDFAQEQARAAALKQQLLRASQAAESRQASDYLRQFVAAARSAGLPEQPLVVKGYNGKGTARTSLTGWYLKADHTLAVDTEGRFYILIDELSLVDRLRGKNPSPSEPPLVLSAGARDGESMDLTRKLTELLPSWRSAGATDSEEQR